MSKPKIMILAGLAVAALVWFASRRKSANAAETGLGLEGRGELPPPVNPPPRGATGASASGKIAAIAAGTATAACVGSGGGPLCGLVGAGAAKVAPTAVKLTKKVVSAPVKGAKSLLKKIF